MAKYFMVWESDESLWPADPKEQAALGMKLGEMVKQGMKEGRTLDWGIFVGGDRGYAVVEGDVSHGSLMAGQSVGLVDSIMSVQEIIDELVMDTEAELERVRASLV